jgi:hypothetical protein
MEIPGNKSRAGLHPDGSIEMLLRHTAKAFVPLRLSFPQGILSHTAFFPTRLSFPHGFLSHTAFFPSRLSFPHGFLSLTAFFPYGFL